MLYSLTLIFQYYISRMFAVVMNFRFGFVVFVLFGIRAFGYEKKIEQRGKEPFRIDLTF